MKQIAKSHFVTEPVTNEEKFILAVGDVIDNMQSSGLEVDVQFQASSAGYSALIIGKTKS